MMKKRKWSRIMFGYVVADLKSMTEEQSSRYRGCYCGLCHMIGSEFGMIQRLTLNYDLTFLALFLSSLYEPSETGGSGRCLMHPLSTHSYWQTEATRYAAAMNIALSYHKCLDDWNDEKRAASRIYAAALKKHAMRVCRQYPRQWHSIQSCMEALRKLEAENCQNPDCCANLFGQLMGELFVWREDHWATTLRAMGEALGRFIYLMDAILDLSDDLNAKRYNPLSNRNDPAQVKNDLFPVLTIMIGECCSAFEQLPLLQDLDLLRNILYSGIWTRYHNQITKEQNHV